MSAGTTDPLCGPIYGALFFSTIISTSLYSVTCMQTCYYYVRYQNDPLRTKVLVTAIWAFNTIQEALTISGTYKYIMDGLENQLSMKNAKPELVLQILFTALVAAPTQGFFIYRVYVFSGNNFAVPFVWVPLAIYQLGSSIFCVIEVLYRAEGVHVVNDEFFMAIAISCLSVAAAVDILATVSLTFLLVRQRHSIGYSSTAHVLQRLTLFAINTGMWTALFAILSLVLLRIYPWNLLYAVFGVPLCSVYCNTLLGNLNVRAFMRDEMMRHNADLSEKDEEQNLPVKHMPEHLEHQKGVTPLDIG